MVQWRSTVVVVIRVVGPSLDKRKRGASGVGGLMVMVLDGLVVVVARLWPSPFMVLAMVAVIVDIHSLPVK